MAPKNAEYGSSSNDDSDEDLNVELKANATKVRMTGASRDSDEPAKESADTISAMNALDHSTRTARARYEAG